MPSLPKRRRARDAVAAAAAAGAARPDADFMYGFDDDGDGPPPPSALDAALDALTSRQAAARSRGLAALHAALRGGYMPDAAARPFSTIAALKAVLGKRGGSGGDAATAAASLALAFLHAGPSADALAGYESVAPSLATTATSVKGGGPALRAAACTALAVGAFVVGDPGGPEVVEAVDALATAAASRVLVGGVVAAGEGPQPAAPPAAASSVAAAALRGLALLATVSWPSQAAALSSDGRLLRALSGALSSGDVDVRHAAGLAAVALRRASGRGASSSSSSSGESASDGEAGGGRARIAAHAALGPALARVRGLASSSHGALNKLAGSGTATPTGGGPGPPLPPLPPPPPPPSSSTGFRCGNGLRLSRAARTEQRRLFRGLEAVGGGAGEVRTAVLRKVAGPGWGDLVAGAPWLGELFGGGGGRGGWGGGAAPRGSARDRERERARGRADRQAVLAGDEEERGEGW